MDATSGHNPDNDQDFDLDRNPDNFTLSNMV